jgi:hypothetical protein
MIMPGLNQQTPFGEPFDDWQAAACMELVAERILPLPMPCMPPGLFEGHLTFSPAIYQSHMDYNAGQ